MLAAWIVAQAIVCSVPWPYSFLSLVDPHYLLEGQPYTAMLNTMRVPGTVWNCADDRDKVAHVEFNP